ncbi:MAG: 3-methyl-2-oxobutanoate dehydrogenase subunit beta, partial [Mucinivorans sp.]
PITLFPFPSEIIKNVSQHSKAILSVEMSAGQMVEDVRLAVGGGCRVEHYGRYGGIVHSPSEVYQALKELMK